MTAVKVLVELATESTALRDLRFSGAQVLERGMRGGKPFVVVSINQIADFKRRWQSTPSGRDSKIFIGVK